MDNRRASDEESMSIEVFREKSSPLPPAAPQPAAQGAGGEAGRSAVAVDSLLDLVRSGSISIPREHRAQKAFFRFLKRAGSDPEMVEQVHRLRDAVILSALRDSSRTGGLTIGVAGVQGGEGTSLMSLLLGLSLGECVHRRVAILDGRFNPDRFQVLSGMLGLSRNSVSLRKGPQEVVGYYNEAHSNVYFLRSAGTERSMEFFSDKRLGLFLGDLRQHFDFTILDLPPLLRDTASVFVVPHVDRLYLVAESQKTQLSQIGKCLQLVRESKGEMTGVILNKQRAPLWSRVIWRDFFF